MTYFVPHSAATLIEMLSKDSGEQPIIFWTTSITLWRALLSTAEAAGILISNAIRQLILSRATVEAHQQRPDRRFYPVDFRNR